MSQIEISTSKYKKRIRDAERQIRFLQNRLSGSVAANEILMKRKHEIDASVTSVRRQLANRRLEHVSEHYQAQDTKLVAAGYRGSELQPPDHATQSASQVSELQHLTNAKRSATSNLVADGADSCKEKVHSFRVSQRKPAVKRMKPHYVVSGLCGMPDVFHGDFEKEETFRIEKFGDPSSDEEQVDEHVELSSRHLKEVTSFILVLWFRCFAILITTAVNNVIP